MQFFVCSTFVCPTEILAFSDRFAEFKKINTEVVACSVDSHFTHLAWINTPRKEGGLGKVNIPLLSDLNHSISKDYGVFLEDLGHTLRCVLLVIFELLHLPTRVLWIMCLFWLCSSTSFYLMCNGIFRSNKMGSVKNFKV